MSLGISRQQYADFYGPTTGDRVRLADTDLLIEIEHDFARYGDEITFWRGQGGTRRNGPEQPGPPRSFSRRPGPCDHQRLDCRSLGHCQRRHWHSQRPHCQGWGKPGNPDIMDGVDPELVVGASTEVIAGENMIVTAGGIDSHIHFISPQQVFEAVSNGITTMIGGGTGPATGTNATTCTPGAWHLARMFEACEAWPMNFGFLGKGNTSTVEPLAEQIRAGACGLKLSRRLGQHARCYRRLPARC